MAGKNKGSGITEQEKGKLKRAEKRKWKW